MARGRRFGHHGWDDRHGDERDVHVLTDRENAAISRYGRQADVAKAMGYYLKRQGWKQEWDGEIENTLRKVCRGRVRTMAWRFFYAFVAVVGADRLFGFLVPLQWFTDANYHLPLPAGAAVLVNGSLERELDVYEASVHAEAFRLSELAHQIRSSDTKEGAHKQAPSKRKRKHAA
jgi:hypothetical protein